MTLLRAIMRAEIFYFIYYEVEIVEDFTLSLVPVCLCRLFHSSVGADRLSCHRGTCIQRSKYIIEPLKQLKRFHIDPTSPMPSVFDTLSQSKTWNTTVFFITSVSGILRKEKSVRILFFVNTNHKFENLVEKWVKIFLDNFGFQLLMISWHQKNTNKRIRFAKNIHFLEFFALHHRDAEVLCRLLIVDLKEHYCQILQKLSS